MNNLNPLEREALNVLLQVRDTCAQNAPMTRADIAWLMGQVRDAIVHLTNKDFGCPTGKHATACKCPKQ